MKKLQFIFVVINLWFYFFHLNPRMVQQIDKQVLDSTLKCLDHFECWPQSAVLVKRLVEISVSYAKKVVGLHCWGAHRSPRRRTLPRPSFQIWRGEGVQTLFNNGMNPHISTCFSSMSGFPCMNIEIPIFLSAKSGTWWSLWRRWLRAGMSDGP